VSFVAESVGRLDPVSRVMAVTMIAVVIGCACALVCRAFR